MEDMLLFKLTATLRIESGLFLTTNMRVTLMNTTPQTLQADSPGSGFRDELTAPFSTVAWTKILRLK